MYIRKSAAARSALKFNTPIYQFQMCRDTGSFESFLSPGQGPARPACSGRRDRAQTRHCDLALLSKGESYVWARPSLHAKKLRDLELRAGFKPARRQKGAAHAYHIKSCRDEERRWVDRPNGLCPLCLRMEPSRPKKGAHRRRKRGATIKAARQVSTSCPALRHAITRAQERITQIRKINSCRSHQWSKDVWA